MQTSARLATPSKIQSHGSEPRKTNMFSHCAIRPMPINDSTQRDSFLFTTPPRACCLPTKYNHSQVTCNWKMFRYFLRVILSAQ